MPRYCLRLFLLCAALFPAGGCATSLTLDAGDSDENENEYHYVENVTAAWRDSAGNVTICAYGLPAGTNHGPGGSRRYSIVYPGASPPEPLFDLHEAIPVHIGNASEVKSACSPSMKGMTPVPVYTIYEPEFRDAPHSGMPDGAMATFLENYAPAPAVYMYRFKVDSGAYSGEHLKLFYLQETAIWDDVRVIEIYTTRR